jgi:hypothetical protein
MVQELQLLLSRELLQSYRLYLWHQCGHGMRGGRFHVRYWFVHDGDNYFRVIVQLRLVATDRNRHGRFHDKQ